VRQGPRARPVTPQTAILSFLLLLLRHLRSPELEATELLAVERGAALTDVFANIDHVDEAGEGCSVVQLVAANVERHPERPEQRLAAGPGDALAHADERR
jgi:hypothetical protein